jgi:hypothetical protein
MSAAAPAITPPDVMCGTHPIRVFGHGGEFFLRTA